MALQDYFDKTVIVERRTSTTTSMGGVIEKWNTHLTISCLIDLLKGDKDRIANQFMENSTHVLMTNTGYDITNADRINHNGKIYRVRHVDEPFARHAEIILEVIVDNV